MDLPGGYHHLQVLALAFSLLTRVFGHDKPLLGDLSMELKVRE